jgi:hypothetical protein
MPLDSGSLTFTIPSYLLSDGTYSTLTGKTQSYLTDLEYPSGFTAYPTGATATSFTFMAIGSSRLAELKKYGSTGYTQTLTSGTISGVTYTGYTIDGLSYKDMANEYTQITGNTANYFTTLPVGYKVGDSPTYATEYVMNKVLTRNEHFLGFVEQPRVYSDVFVERGKQGVMEMNLRLGEIDNMGELRIYGNGFFNVKKQ